MSCLVLLSCGFHLRGLSSIPFESVYIQASNRSTALDIKRRIESSSKTTVPDDPKDASVILHIINAKHRRVILSVSSSGRVREFILHYFLSFRVTDQKGQIIIPVTEIRVSRVLPFSDQSFLSAQSEQRMMLREMKEDSILKLMRRLEKVKPLNQVK